MERNIWQDAWNRIDVAFQMIATSLERLIPDLYFKSHTFHNERFPFVANATYGRKNIDYDDLHVDIEIEFSLEDDVIIGQVSVSEGNGIIIEEIPPTKINLHLPDQEKRGLIEAFINDTMLFIDDQKLNIINRFTDRMDAGN